MPKTHLLLIPLLTACSGGVTLDDTATTSGTTDSVPDSFPAAPEVLINEFMASNASTITDPSGGYPDWVELYNATSEVVYLEDWTLTDNLEKPAKWTFPADTSIEAGGHLLIWVDSDEGQEGIHTSFNLDKQGEQVGISASPRYGSVLVDAIEYAGQATDISSARMPDGSSTWEADTTPTPGATNE
jgi:hypothetical protein